MRAVIWKEWRQGIGPAALYLICISFLSVAAITARGADHTALLDNLFTEGGVVFPIVALIFGVAKFTLDSWGDWWALLTHRPVQRSTLFFGKAFAGLSLYLLATAIPLAAALAWISVPSHFQAPFDLRMALPGIVDLFCGAAFFFAGALIVMRDARWYGSRLAGIGVPIFGAFAARVSTEFWQAMLWAVVAIVITGAAALGTFVAGGRYETQPRVFRAATGVSVGAGLLLAMFIANAVPMIFFFISHGMLSRSYKTMPDGTIVLTSQMLGRVLDARDLEGRPVQQSQDVEAKRLLLGTGGISLPLRPGDSGTYRDTSRFFFQMEPSNAAEATTWYYVTRSRLFADYDNESGDIVGWLGPGGFSSGGKMPARNFEASLSSNDELRLYSVIHNAATPLLVSPDAVYRVDLAGRSVERLFAADSGESILGAGQWGNMMRRPDYFAFSTTQRTVVAGADGIVRFSVVRDPEVSTYGAVVVSRAGSDMVLWYYPAVKGTDRVSAPPVLVTRLSAEGTFKQRFRLPFQPVLTPPAWGRVFLPWVVTPITAPAAAAISNGRFNWHSPDAQLGTSSDAMSGSAWSGAESYSQSQLAIVWTLCALASLVPTILAYRRGRKYAFTRGRLAIWTALAFVFGPVGFLLMLSLLDWPAHEKCPACARMRVVNRELCEFCGAPFPSPAPDGTEVLDLLSEAS